MKSVFFLMLNFVFGFIQQKPHWILRNQQAFQRGSFISTQTCSHLESVLLLNLALLRLFQWNHLLAFTLPLLPITQKCRNQITSPFGVKTDHNALLIAVQLKIQPEPLTPSILDQLNGKSCFPHRDLSEKLVSRQLDFHCLPVYQ